MDRKIVQKEQGDQILIYPAQYYYLELNTARMLRELDIFCPEDEKIVERRIVQIEKETGTVLDEMQKKAVQEAAGHGLLILTGGPGTGKTTTINAIIRYFEGEGAEIRLAAPTGRAAKRMTEATGYEAQTIHRLLELSGMPEDDREGQPIHLNEMQKILWKRMSLSLMRCRWWIYISSILFLWQLRRNETDPGRRENHFQVWDREMCFAILSEVDSFR